MRKFKVYLHTLMAKTSSKAEFVPRALAEVVAWKDAMYRQVRGLPLEEAIETVVTEGEAAARKHGAWPGSQSPNVALVAESRVSYITKEE